MPLLLKEDEAQLEQAWKGEVRVPGGLGSTTNSEGRHDTNTPLNRAVALPCVVSGRRTGIHSPKTAPENWRGGKAQPQEKVLVVGMQQPGASTAWQTPGSSTKTLPIAFQHAHL